MEGPQGAIPVKVSDSQDGCFTASYDLPLQLGHHRIEILLDGTTI